MAAVIGNREISLGVMGGTLITAACYGGGDVFGCSPYDAATTAYLKATYPSYWAQIRDYGYANPQLVPWINEDNDLIVSLVEVGKERAIRNNANSYFDTNVIAQPTDIIEIDCLMSTVSASRFFGAQDGSVYVQINYDGGTVNHFNGSSGKYGAFNIASYTTRATTIFNGNNVTRGSYSGVVAPTNACRYTLAVWGRHNGVNNYDVFGGKLDIWKLKIGNHTFVPFKRNGQMELLDIVTGTLATRVGTFTELIE